jgi:hypothetical protein
MTHDGQYPGAQAGPLSEEVAKAQSSLAGGLHQIHSFFRIASELVGVATENRELSYQITSKGVSCCISWWVSGAGAEGRIRR